MDTGEAITILGDVEHALARVRVTADLAQYGVGERRRQRQIDMSLSIFDLQKAVDRLAGGPAPKRSRRRRDAGVECDHCGGPADEYGDCLGGPHPW